MYIVVKYGQNESLLCNPSCAVINLLTSIKRRTGYEGSDVTIDLSDETGLIKDLDLHKHDYATKYLASHNTYILVEKQLLPNDDDVDGRSTPPPPQYTFVPLLDQWADLFPNYKLHVAEVQKKRKQRINSKSPSPAGRISSKSKREKRTVPAKGKK